MSNKLKNAVIRRIGGKDALRDVYNHGADAGYPGFTYYKDTCSFFRRHKADIVSLAEDMANNLGENPLDMIASFNCLHGDYSTSEIGKVLYGRWNDSDDTFTIIGNALAWFALEEVARSIYDH